MDGSTLAAMLFLGAFVVIHVLMHRGHGGHGGSGTHQGGHGQEEEDDDGRRS